MRKVLLISFIVLALAGSAFAQRGMGNGPAVNGNGAGYNCPYPDCPNDCFMGRGYGMGMRGPNANIKATVTTAEQAKKAVAEEIKDLKGYSITEVDTMTGRRGNTSFRVYVKDGSGNTFFYHVNPWGNVRGPVSFIRSK